MRLSKTPNASLSLHHFWLKRGHRNDVDGDGDTYTVLNAETVHFTFFDLCVVSEPYCRLIYHLTYHNDAQSLLNILITKVR